MKESKGIKADPSGSKRFDRAVFDRDGKDRKMTGNLLQRTTDKSVESPSGPGPPAVF